MLNASIALLLAGVAGVLPTTFNNPPEPLRPVPFARVGVEGPFWGPRLAAVREGTLEANLHQCEITGRLRNFDRAAGKEAGEFEGLLFNDSDVYKVMEGWAYVLATESDPPKRAALEARLDALVARVAAAQAPDGYINTYYALKAGMPKRFTREEHDHETYCMGHLIEAAVAHFEVTGKRTFLDVGIRAADFLDGLYGEGKFTAPPGHQELELALVKLWRVTAEDRYARLATFLVEQRGRSHRGLDGSVDGPWGEYNQDHAPVRDQTQAVGHAVRAAYFYSAVTDLAAMTGDEGYRLALDALWRDVFDTRIFITGGIGPSAHNEGFTEPFDIPTYSAYQETCASIALAFWAHRMSLLHADASYMDVFERGLYNSVLAGVSLDGRKFNYVNPLAAKAGGGHTRRDWFPCACCPPNVLRFLASIGGYAYAVRGDQAYVNLYVPGAASLPLASGKVRVTQETDYPWDGRVRLTITSDTPAPRELFVRIPGWCRGFTLARNGAPCQAGPPERGYVRVPVTGTSDRVELRLDMPIERVYSHPKVRASLGHVAIQRGPIVYTMEDKDNAEPITLASALLPVSGSLKARPTDDPRLGRFIAIEAEGAIVSRDEREGVALYAAGAAASPATLTLIPYCMWDNRGVASMQIWIPESPAFLPLAPAAGITATASYIGNGDGTAALFDRGAPASSADQTIPRFTFWPHKGGIEWVAYEFARPRRIDRAAVYWFDDSGVGQCRVPDSATLEWRSDSGDWAPVAGAGPIGVKKDGFNEVRFEPVTTRGLRLRIALQEKFSAGVLEWSIGDARKGTE
ncbi:MAG: glycoside hydrolase family 127 protein [Phycisphaerae bacterium]|nr:glycoside hydrolase family 127 protein [Phycisphaerae bacterium]